MAPEVQWAKAPVKRQLSLWEPSSRVTSQSSPSPELPWSKPTRAFCCPKAGIRTHSWEWQKHTPNQSLRYPFQQQGYCEQDLPCLQLQCRLLLVCTIWKQGKLLKLFYMEERHSPYQEWTCGLSISAVFWVISPQELHMLKNTGYSINCSSSALSMKG